jgi:hypothetical protein
MARAIPVKTDAALTLVVVFAELAELPRALKWYLTGRYCYRLIRRETRNERRRAKNQTAPFRCYATALCTGLSRLLDPPRGRQDLRVLCEKFLVLRSFNELLRSEVRCQLSNVSHQISLHESSASTIRQYQSDVEEAGTKKTITSSNLQFNRR